MKTHAYIHAKPDYTPLHIDLPVYQAMNQAEVAFTDALDAAFGRQATAVRYDLSLRHLWTPEIHALADARTAAFAAWRRHGEDVAAAQDWLRSTTDETCI